MSDVTVEGFRWAAIPEDLLFDAAISPEAVRVYGVLLRHGTDPGSCYPSHRRIAQLIGKSPRSVPRWVRELEVAGWVQVVPRTASQGDPDSNGYRVFDHAQPSAGVPAGSRTPLPADQRGGYAQDSAPNESQVNDSQPNDLTSAPAAPPADPALFEVPTVVDELCTELATAVGKFADAPPPAVTKRWRNDMRLLLERGPLHQQDPAPTAPDAVRQCLQVVFTELAEPEGRGGFCWAAQIRSPHALRDHWHQMRVKARQQRERLRGGRMEALARQAGDAPDALSQTLADVVQRREQRTLAALGHVQLPALGAGA